MMIPTLLGVSIIVFLFIRLIPGDIVQILSGAQGEMTPERHAASPSQPRPRPATHGPICDWLSGVVRGDLGNSLKTHRPIRADLLSRLPVTVELTIGSAIIGLAIGIPAGIIAALKRGTRTELVAQGAGLIGLSVPDFWLGTLFLLVASRYFGWYPGARYVSIFDDPGRKPRHFILPCLAVGIGLSASLMRITRSSLLDVMGSGYIVTARAKGLRPGAVLFGHALKNALVPIVTIIGLQLGYLLGGVVIVETVFNLPASVASSSMRSPRAITRSCRLPS